MQTRRTGVTFCTSHLKEVLSVCLILNLCAHQNRNTETTLCSKKFLLQDIDFQQNCRLCAHLADKGGPLKLSKQGGPDGLLSGTCAPCTNAESFAAAGV